MPEIVFVYNYGDNDFIDVYANEEVCIKSKGYIPMSYNKAVFFIGDGTEKDKIRVAFRRGGVAPTLKMSKKIEDILSLPIVEDKPPVLVEVPEDVPIPQQYAPDVVHSGKYAGQLWEDVLSPDNFNAGYWRTTINIMKNIPEHVKDNIKILLTNKG